MATDLPNDEAAKNRGIFGDIQSGSPQNIVLFFNKKQPLCKMKFAQNFIQYSLYFNASFFSVFFKFFLDKFGGSVFFSTFVHPMLCY
jgi:hypothetical protein